MMFSQKAFLPGILQHRGSVLFFFLKIFMKFLNFYEIFSEKKENLQKV